MTEKEKMTIKLKEIALKLTEIVSDEEIKVIINNSERTISFLNHSFSIPGPENKQEYIKAMSEILKIFQEEKEKIKKLKELEIFKKNEELNKQKNNEKTKEKQKIQDLSYTQNLSYIQNIIKKNSDFSKKEVVKSEKLSKKEIAEENNNFKYGIKISENDSLKNSDWFDISEDKIEFVILTAFQNDRFDRKFKSYLKKCREHDLCSGIFWRGEARNINEAKNEISELTNILQTYKIIGPIIYEINNMAVSKASEIKNISKLKNVYQGAKFIIDELTKKGYFIILNVDLSTISTLVNNKIMTTKDIPLIYNVLPSQTAQIDESCQIIEFNPKHEYEKVKLSQIYFKTK